MASPRGHGSSVVAADVRAASLIDPERVPFAPEAELSDATFPSPATPCSPVALATEANCSGEARSDAAPTAAGAPCGCSSTGCTTGARCVSRPMTVTSSGTGAPPTATARASVDAGWSVAAASAGSEEPERPAVRGRLAAPRHRAPARLGPGRSEGPSLTRSQRQPWQARRAAKDWLPAAGSTPRSRHPPRDRSHPRAEPRAVARRPRPRPAARAPPAA